MSPSPSGASTTGASTHGHGRGGRGGFQRGGARGGRGGGRGGAFAGRPSSRNQAKEKDPAPVQLASNDWGAEPGSTDPAAVDWGTADSTNTTWGQAAITSWAEDTSASKETKAEETPAPAPAPTTNGIAKTPTPTLAPAKAKPVPGTIRSWAQVARYDFALSELNPYLNIILRPQEKPKLNSQPEPAPVQDEPAPAPEPEVPQTETEPQTEAEKVELVWEELTTAQAPIWDDEPVKVSAAKKDVDASSPVNSTVVQETPVPQAAEVTSPSVEQTTPALTMTSEVSSTVPSSIASPTPPPTNSTTSKPVTSRAASSRVASRFKPDQQAQAVVMPSFGSVSAGGIGMGLGGMKFGSLSINDDVDADG